MILRHVVFNFLKVLQYRSNNLYFLKPTLFYLPCRSLQYRSYPHLVKNRNCYYLKNQWNTIFIRNITKRSRKDMLLEYFYSNVYRGFLVIGVSSLVYLKLIGMKLFILQLTPIVVLLRNQIPSIMKNFTRDIKYAYYVS